MAELGLKLVFLQIRLANAVDLGVRLGQVFDDVFLQTYTHLKAWRDCYGFLVDSGVAKRLMNYDV